MGGLSERWRKSTRSGGNNGACVEVAHTLAAIRDSKNPRVAVSVDAQALLAAVKAGRLG